VNIFAQECRDPGVFPFRCELFRVEQQDEVEALWDSVLGNHHGVLCSEAPEDVGLVPERPEEVGGVSRAEISSLEVFHDHDHGSRTLLHPLKHKLHPIFTGCGMKMLLLSLYF